ncbi:Hypothetical protein ZAZAV_471 [Cedratvirus Zaza IHUMI]|uniref:Uncharacterized protein n=1 Tax=Cedratvirus Zaza IHUMI TaxID=2126979 RepID=A0A2R8FFK7_9VIRU|nr:Hypothetical protein ZAZAV_471 [Cedratvirus Zaza IHUMI]
MQYTHIIVRHEHIKPEIMSKLGGSAAHLYFSIKERGEGECLIEVNLEDCTIDFWDVAGSYRYVLYEEEEITDFIKDVVDSRVAFENHS